LGPKLQENPQEKRKFLVVLLGHFFKVFASVNALIYSS
jgi:hypothetical protein